MLDDLAVVVQAEDVDPGPVAVTRPLLVAVENDVVALGDGPLEVDALVNLTTWARYARLIA